MLHSRCVRLLDLCKRVPSLGKTRCYSKLDFEEYEDLSQKTSIEMASEDSELHHLYLMGYTVGGFKFTQSTINGPIAIADLAVFGWNIVKPEDITIESLSLFSIVHPKLDIVVIGTGDTFQPLPPSIHKEMKSRGIALEVQRTSNACGVYNLLRTKGSQIVGAALIPITDNFPRQQRLAQTPQKIRSNPFIGEGDKN